MGDGDGCRYVGVDLSWRRIWNCRAWGLGVRYHVGRVNLDNRILVYCGSRLDSYCVGGGDGFRYVGVDVSLGQVMAEQRSLRRLFMLIPVGLVLPDCLISCVLRFVYCVFNFEKVYMEHVTKPCIPTRTFILE